MTSLPYNIRPNLAGDYPQIDPTALIDPSAQIIGNVQISRDVFVGPLAVIRADQRGPDGKVVPIQIDSEVNIQDGVIIHSNMGTSVIIGPKTTIAHGVIIHGPCTIGRECFLALGASLYKVTLEDHVWMGTNQGVHMRFLMVTSRTKEWSVLAQGLEKGTAVELVWVASGAAALQAIQDKTFDLVLVDETLEDKAGLDIENVYIGIGGSHISTVNTISRIEVMEPENGVTDNDIANLISYTQNAKIPINKHLMFWMRLKLKNIIECRMRTNQFHRTAEEVVSD